ncbi:MAG TPA: histidine phosphotransferase family protein [Aestuariivirga sp.]|nr:histidine phosphotransferase family protein [Aestuariivirga sp.]
MTDALRLSDLDLAALLCSRVCHDIISPAGAIANALELYDDPDMDAETRATALDMVRNSARTATARLKFCRIAFGAAGSAGAHIDLSEAGETAKAFMHDEKAKLDWQAPRENRPKQQVKLILNMLLMAMAGVPRGGLVTVSVEGDAFTVRAKGDRARVPEPMAEVLAGRAALESLDARLVQPYYARILADAAGLELAMAMDGEDVLVTARPRDAAAAPAA